ncbi:MAG TPA: hypothetical protein VEN79_09340, partial [Terriglobia bacterium]|nr:hypothetical protein [Terriglobia bacterium]
MNIRRREFMEVLGASVTSLSLRGSSGGAYDITGTESARAQGPGATEQGILVTLDNGLIRRSMTPGADGSL